MQTLAAIENNSRMVQNIPSGGGIGKLVARLFGCRHKEMSRPFSHQGQSYRTCVECGASRRFNLGRWETHGDFFYRMPTSHQLRAISATRKLNKAVGKGR